METGGWRLGGATSGMLFDCGTGVGGADPCAHWQVTGDFGCQWVFDLGGNDYHDRYQNDHNVHFAQPGWNCHSKIDHRESFSVGPANWLWTAAYWAE